MAKCSPAARAEGEGVARVCCVGGYPARCGRPKPVAGAGHLGCRMRPLRRILGSIRTGPISHAILQSERVVLFPDPLQIVQQHLPLGFFFRQAPRRRLPIASVEQPVLGGFRLLPSIMLTQLPALSSPNLPAQDVGHFLLQSSAALPGARCSSKNHSYRDHSFRSWYEDIFRSDIISTFAPIRGKFFQLSVRKMRFQVALSPPSGPKFYPLHLLSESEYHPLKKRQLEIEKQLYERDAPDPRGFDKSVPVHKSVQVNQAAEAARAEEFQRRLDEEREKHIEIELTNECLRALNIQNRIHMLAKFTLEPEERTDSRKARFMLCYGVGLSSRTLVLERLKGADLLTQYEAKLRSLQLTGKHAEEAGFRGYPTEEELRRSSAFLVRPDPDFHGLHEKWSPQHDDIGYGVAAPGSDAVPMTEWGRRHPLRRRSTFFTKVNLDLVGQIAEITETLEWISIKHSDVKPDNVVVEVDECRSEDDVRREERERRGEGAGGPGWVSRASSADELVPSNSAPLGQTPDRPSGSEDADESVSSSFANGDAPTRRWWSYLRGASTLACSPGYPLAIRLVFIDFGLATVYAEPMADKPRGSVPYISPETFPPLSNVQHSGQTAEMRKNDPLLPEFRKHVIAGRDIEGSEVHIHRRKNVNHEDKLKRGIVHYVNVPPLETLRILMPHQEEEERTESSRGHGVVGAASHDPRNNRSCRRDFVGHDTPLSIRDFSNPATCSSLPPVVQPPSPITPHPPSSGGAPPGGRQSFNRLRTGSAIKVKLDSEAEDRSSSVTGASSALDECNVLHPRFCHQF